MFFILDGTLLWIVLFIVTLGLFGTVQSDKPGWCSFILGVTIIGLEFFSPYHPLTAAYHHPLESILYIVGYALAGTVWSVIKWTSYVHM